MTSRVAGQKAAVQKKTAAVAKKAETPLFELTVAGRSYRLFLGRVTIRHEELLEISTNGRLKGLPSIENRMASGDSGLLTIAGIMFLARLQEPEDDEPVRFADIKNGLSYTDGIVWTVEDDEEEPPGETSGDAST